jgi:hypothetical protein
LEYYVTISAAHFGLFHKEETEGGDKDMKGGGRGIKEGDRGEEKIMWISSFLGYFVRPFWAF